MNAATPPRQLLEEAAKIALNPTVKAKIALAIAELWPSPAASMLVGLDIYKLGVGSANAGLKAGPEVAGCVKTVRFSGTEKNNYGEYEPNAVLEAWKALGCNVVIMDSSANLGGIKLESPAAWAARCVLRQQCKPAAIEIGNEVYGDWFWGPEALSETAANAYIAILKACREAMDKQYGHGNYAPLLASCEGGGKATWTEMLAKKGLASYVDGVTCHPYPGREPRTAALLGHRDKVEQVHKITGLPVWVTEVGWQTTPQEEGYVQFSPEEQASAIKGFVTWAKSTGYVKCVVIYAYEERGEGFGVVDDSWHHKPAYQALHEVQ